MSYQRILGTLEGLRVVRRRGGIFVENLPRGLEFQVTDEDVIYILEEGVPGDVAIDLAINGTVVVEQYGLDQHNFSLDEFIELACTEMPKR